MKNLVLSFLLILIVSLVGCNPSNPPQSITPTTQETSKTLIPLKNTLNPTSTATNQAEPLSSEITVTPRSTFTVIEAKDFFSTKLKRNGSCNLPCIWGIQPTKDLDQDALDFINQVDEINIEGDIYLKTKQSNDYRRVDLLFWENNFRTMVNLEVFRRVDKPYLTTLHGEIDLEKRDGGLVESKPAYGEFPSNPFLQIYWLPNILKTYGKPAQVLMFTPMESEMGSELPMAVLLIYPEQGFLASYVFPHSVREDEFVGCPLETAYFYIVGWDSSNDLNIQQMFSKFDGLIVNPTDANKYRPIQEVSEWNIDGFYQKFQNSEARDCIATPKDIWTPLH